MGPRNQHTPKWTMEDLKAAMEAVANGMPKRQASSRFGIPYGTLQDKLLGRRKIVPENKTILSKKEEEEMVEWLKWMSKYGFGRSKEELFITVKSMLDFRGRTTSWEDNKPSHKWFRLFKKRHPTIVYRKPQKLGNLRAFLTVGMIEEWHKNFVSAIKEIDATILLEGHRIFSCDERGFAIDATSNRVLADMQDKYVYQVGTESRTMITVLACASAAGKFLSPMMIYPGKQFRGFQPQNVFPESFITKSQNGWITQEIFTNWLEQVFIEETKHLKKPILLLVDGHVSHQSIRTFQLCVEHNIILYCLLAHASHILQPLDVGVFKTMKAEWRTAVQEHTYASSEVVTKRNFASVWKKAYESTVANHLCPMAFRKSGIFPPDLDAIDFSKIVRRGPTTTANEWNTSLAAPTNTAHEWSTNPAAPTATANELDAVTPAVTTSIPNAMPHDQLTSSAVSNTLGNGIPEITDPMPSATNCTPLITSAPTSNLAEHIASSSSSDLTTAESTLYKYSLICNQITLETLEQYFGQLKEGKKGEPLFELWKVYHGQIMNPQTPQKSKSNPLLQAPPSVISESKRKRNTEKFPDFMSGQEMINMLIAKADNKKEEERQKAERKVQQEQRKEEVERKKKEKQKKAEKRRFWQEQKKKEADRVKIEEKKNERQLKRILLEEQNRKSKKQRRDAEDSDTSVDESQMILESEGENEATEDSLIGAMEDILPSSL